MAVCRCLIWPNACLCTAAKPVEAITYYICALRQDMVDTMEEMPGVGFAATKIGVMLRLGVVDALQILRCVIYLANTKILESFIELYEHEAAGLNLPDFLKNPGWPKSVPVRFTNKQCVIDRQEFTNLWATSVQHQTDRLHRKIYFDNLYQMRWSMLLKKARKVK